MGGLIVHRSAFDYCSFFDAGYVGCMKELNINGANIDLVSYAHQQDSGKNFDKEAGRGKRSRAVPVRRVQQPAAD